jgi:biotin carboxyl carrier protein
MKVTREFVRDGETVAVQAEAIDGGRWRVRVGERVLEFVAVPMVDGGVRLTPAGEHADGHHAVGSRGFVAYGAAAGKEIGGREFQVRLRGRTHTLALPSGRRGGAAAGGDGIVRAPMTGTVLDVRCKVGDEVAADQTLAVVTAMKMEHKLVAGVAGVVREVQAQKGATVEQGDALVTVEAKAKA